MWSVLPRPPARWNCCRCCGDDTLHYDPDDLDSDSSVTVAIGSRCEDDDDDDDDDIGVDCRRRSNQEYVANCTLSDEEEDDDDDNDNRPGEGAEFAGRGGVVYGDGLAALRDDVQEYKRRVTSGDVESALDHNGYDNAVFKKNEADYNHESLL